MAVRANVIGRLREAATLLAIAGEYARSEAFAEVATTVTEECPEMGLDGWLRGRRDEAPTVSHEVAWSEALDVCLGRRSGTVERLRRGLPPDVVRLLRVRGMSPVRISRAWRELGVDGLVGLKAALSSGRLVEAAVLDEETASQLPRVIKEYEEGCGGWLRPQASRVASSLLSHLRDGPSIESVALVGDIARLKTVCGSVETLVSAFRPEEVVEWLSKWVLCGSAIEESSGWLTCHTHEGMACHVGVCLPAHFPAHSYRLRSSADHWQRVSDLACQLGVPLEVECNLAEGISRPRPASEQELADALEMVCLPPELRDGHVERLWDTKSPAPITLEEIRGDLHCHSTFSDGTDTVDQLLDGALSRGYEYLAVTDHAKSTWIASGLDCAGVEAYLRELTAIQKSRTDIHLLKGLEVDILADGTLDLPDEVLVRLDVVIGSVHSDFHLSTGDQLRRIRRAMENPLVHVLAHPTGRLLGKRSSMPIPLLPLVQMAAQTGTWLEVNGNPERLDLWAEGLRLCKSHGVPVLISSDAHRRESLGQMEWGVQEARCGRLESQDVVNTRGLTELRYLLAKKRAGR